MAKSTSINAPQTGSKLATLVSALGGKGATLRALSKQLGWQSHTVRAALTRLRQRGNAIERIRKPGAVSSTYRLKRS